MQEILKEVADNPIGFPETRHYFTFPVELSAGSLWAPVGTQCVLCFSGIISAELGKKGRKSALGIIIYRNSRKTVPGIDESATSPSFSKTVLPCGVLTGDLPIARAAIPSLFSQNL